MIITYRFAAVDIRLCSDDYAIKFENKYLPYHTENCAGEDMISIQVHKVRALPETILADQPDFCTSVISYWGNSHNRIYKRGEGEYACFERIGAKRYRLSFLESANFTCMKETDLWNRIPLESILLDRECLILHSSYICRQNKAILFFAPSGTGKSTQAELWRQHRNAQIVNGDRSLLTLEAGKLYAHGLPFCGSSKYFENIDAEVAALVYLVQSPENRTRSLQGREAVMRLFAETTVNNWDPEAVNKVLNLLTGICASVLVYELSCTPDEGAVACLEQRMENI